MTACTPPALASLSRSAPLDHLPPQPRCGMAYNPILPHTTRPLTAGATASNRSTISLYRRQAIRASVPNCDSKMLTFPRLIASSVSNAQ